MNNNHNKEKIAFNELNNLINNYNNNMNNSNNNLFYNNQTQVFNKENAIEPKIIEPTPIKINNLIQNNNVYENKNEIINNENQKNRALLIKEKTKNNQAATFDDGIDTEYTKKTIKDILVNKKLLSIIMILIFISVCILVVKAFYLGNKVDTYEEFFTTIEKKAEEFVKIYEGSEIDNEVLKKVAASELINCINSKVEVDKLPDSINNIIKEINNYYNQSNNYFSFKYKDIFTGFSVSYNENQNIFTASTIKAPKDIYLYEMASLGKIDLNKELTYTGNYYNSGSGILKNKNVNTKYSVKNLIEFSTVYSDNIAHNMLMDEFGRNNMYDFWYIKGATAIFSANNNWGVTNAHDASIYMEELYRFYVENDEYGEILMNNFINARPKFISGKNNYVIANKSGWSGSAIHDVSIIFADNPYIIVALSNLGDTDYYMSYFNKANDFAYRLHTEYWKYKMDICNNINQY